MKHPVIRRKPAALPQGWPGTLENPLPCPWPGAEQRTNRDGSPAAIHCWHCHGTGILHHYSHIANGVCFSCKGRGWQYIPNR